MIKIYRYELQYILCNKLFIGFSCFLAIFSYYLISDTLLLGTSYTAPFSIYSFAHYCLLLLPVLFIAITSLNHLYFTDNHQKRLIIFERCSYSKQDLRFIQLGTLASATILWICLILCSALLFYLTTFHVFQPLKYFTLAFFLLLPPSLCYLWLVHRLCRNHPNLSPLLCIAFILLTQISFEINPFSSAYFIQIPLRIPLDTTLPIPLNQFLTRLLLITLPLIAEIKEKSKTS